MSPDLAPDEAWCAAHLNMLCSNALIADKNFNTYNTSDGVSHQRGMLIPYESLPGSLSRIVLPLFGLKNIDVQWLKKMKAESQFYSKGRQVKKVGKFSGDSQEKNRKSSYIVKLWASSVLLPSYEAMRRASNKGLEQLVRRGIVNDDYSKVLLSSLSLPNASTSVALQSWSSVSTL